MNAPATSTTVRREARAATATNLQAWDLIHTLASFDTTSRESNLALRAGP
jgi:hypothetical protein